MHPGSTEYTLFLGVAFISAVYCVVGASTCPTNVGDRIQECTSIVVPDLSITDHIKVVRETCKEAKLRQVADCIQGIVDQCKGTTEDEQMIQRLIDKDRLLSTVEYFCRYFRVYETHAECMFDHHEEVSECSKDAKTSFGTKMSSGANIDVLMMGSCKFHDIARGCLRNITLLECGREAGDFVYNLLSGMSPPYCEEAYPGYDSNGQWVTSESENNNDTNGSQTLASLTSLVLLGIQFLKAIV